VITLVMTKKMSSSCNYYLIGICSFSMQLYVMILIGLICTVVNNQIKSVLLRN
jgi:hypothetical protein